MSHWRGHPFSLAIALAGAAYMAMLVFGLVLRPEAPFIGTRLYDVYARALLNGSFALPLRELQGEGHYTPEGVGYLYHGLGPLLTRLPFVAFVDLPTRWIAPLSIWFWAVLGNGAYHAAFGLALRRAGLNDAKLYDAARTLLALAIWMGAPGLLLCANASVFYEPVAMAYALGGGFVLVLVRLAFSETTWERALVPLALCAGLMVHARPHLAVGLYAGTCLLIGAMLLRHRCAGAVKAAIAALLLLGLFGGALLGVNALRFHDPAMMHGSFANGDLRYGMVFWGAEDENSPRAQAFERYGQFNARRVVPNGLMYAAALPAGGPTDTLRVASERAFIGSYPWMGYVRVEAPNIGVIYLWPLWVLLMVIGLRQRMLWRPPAIAGVVAGGIGALLLLSYATITLRYHVDLWQLIAVPAVFGVAPLAQRAASTEKGFAGRWKGATALTTMIGIALTAVCVTRSRDALTDPHTVLSREACLQVTAKKGFDPARRDELCRLEGEEPGPPPGPR